MVVTAHIYEDAGMTPSEFKSSVANGQPPAGLAGPLEALWWAAKGDWEKAHTIVMNDEGADAGLGACLPPPRGGRSAERRLLVPAGKRETATGPLEAEWAAMSPRLLAKAS